MKKIGTNLITIAIVTILVTIAGIFIFNKLFPDDTVGKEYYDKRMDKQDIRLDSLILVTKRIDLNIDTINLKTNLVLNNQIILQDNMDTLKKGQSILYQGITKSSNLRSYFQKLIREW